MKKCSSLLAMMLMLIATFCRAQSSTSPDSVCAGATGKSYKVTATSGNTCHWSLTGGGTIHTTASTDSIVIDWSSTAGVDTIKIVETNPIGCLGDTVSLAVVRLPIPTVALSGTDSICQYSASVSGNLRMNFTGVSPWTIAYLEDGTTRNVTTTSNPYTFNSQVYSSAGVKSYSITTLAGRLGCSGTKSGSAAVTVFPKPSTSSIIHY
jgi:hypothetical protein